MIPIQDASAVKVGSRCGQTKHQKYGEYIEILASKKAEIVDFLLENIDKSPNNEILIKAVDIAKELGPRFEKLGENAVHWGLKFALFMHGIFVRTTRAAEINTKTGECYLLLRMRRSKEGDVLSPELTKYLEPIGDPTQDEKVIQCVT